MVLILPENGILIFYLKPVSLGTCSHNNYNYIYIMANKNKLKPKGHLYISSPTLEGLALLCENAKKAAHISGIEYSNFP